MGMERFLRYSLERHKPIRMIFLDPSGRMRQVSAIVEQREAGRAQLYILRPPQRLTVPETDILGASYAPGDEGA